MTLPYFAGKRYATAALHAEIRQHKSRRETLDNPQCFRHVARFAYDPEAVDGIKTQSQPVAHELMIVYQQNVDSACHVLAWPGTIRESSTGIAAVRPVHPGRDSIVKEPLSDSTRSRILRRPMPCRGSDWTAPEPKPIPSSIIVKTT